MIFPFPFSNQVSSIQNEWVPESNMATLHCADSIDNSNSNNQNDRIADVDDVYNYDVMYLCKVDKSWRHVIFLGNEKSVLVYKVFI